MPPATDTCPAGEAYAYVPEPGRALHLQLDYPLPDRLAVGAGTAVFVCGWCFSPGARIRSLSFLVDGEVQPVMAQLMPRGDVFKALHPAVDPYDTRGLDGDPDSDMDPELRSFRSGFWGLVKIAPRRTAGELQLRLRAVLDDGDQPDADLGCITVDGAPETPPDIEPPAPRDGPLVAVCMATFNPPPAAVSPAARLDPSPDPRATGCASSPTTAPTPRASPPSKRPSSGDPRFLVSRSPERLHFYRNFERALTLAPTSADYVAMSDQDDSWHPDKLETLLGAIGRCAARLQRRPHRRPRRQG